MNRDRGRQTVNYGLRGLCTRYSAEPRTEKFVTDSILPLEEVMYVFFMPALLALVVIGSITLRDQFRFSSAN
jgi:hypothetical protein